MSQYVVPLPYDSPMQLECIMAVASTSGRRGGRTRQLNEHVWRSADVGGAEGTIGGGGGGGCSGVVLRCAADMYRGDAAGLAVMQPVWR